MTFTCPHCGKGMDGHPTDYGWKLPDDVWAIPEPERERQAKYTTDLCQYNERYFIRGLIELPFTERAGYYGWGIWIEVDWPTFQKYLDAYERDATDWPRVSGRLANQPPGYESLMGRDVEVQFGSSSERPNVWFPKDSTLMMAREQRTGIDNARYHEILRSVGAL